MIEFSKTYRNPEYSGNLILFILLSSFLIAASTFGYQSQPGQDLSATKSTQRPYIVNNKVYYPVNSAQGYTETGTASWYGKQFHGKKTSSGEIYNMNAKTAAHKTLPLGTMVLVKNLGNGKQVIVRINDRGPFTSKRIIDLSYATAKELDFVSQGIAEVEIIALEEKKELGQELLANKKKEYPQDFNRGKFYVQVGSFTVKTNADRLARKFASQGRNVIIQQVIYSKKTFFRVMVFAGSTLSSARRLEQQLNDNGFPGSFVIAK